MYSFMHLFDVLHVSSFPKELITCTVRIHTCMHTLNLLNWPSCVIIIIMHVASKGFHTLGGLGKWPFDSMKTFCPSLLTIRKYIAQLKNFLNKSLYIIVILKVFPLEMNGLGWMIIQSYSLFSWLGSSVKHVSNSECRIWKLPLNDTCLILFGSLLTVT